MGFHPDTLKTSRRLRTLTLHLRQSKCCFIPPVNDLRRPYGFVSAENKDKDEDKDMSKDGDDEGFGGDVLSHRFVTRPRWTWDWQLPILTTLRLNSEFAYWFKFKMLHGCPCLTTSSLHMRTAFGHHTQVITQADLSVPGAEEGSQELIVASSLRRLYMNGHWSFENPSVLMRFVGRMFPKLEKLTTKAWQSVTIGLFVEALRAKSRTTTEAAVAAEGAGIGVSPLTTTTLFWPRPSKEEEVEWGVFPLPCQHANYDQRAAEYSDQGKDVVWNRLICSGTEYIIRRDREVAVHTVE